MKDLAKKVVVNAVSIGAGIVIGLATVVVVDEVVDFSVGIGKTIIRKFKKEGEVKNV